MMLRPVVLAALLMLAPTARADHLDIWLGGLTELSYGCVAGSPDCAASADQQLLTPGVVDGDLELDFLSGFVDLTLNLFVEANFTSVGFSGLYTAESIPVVVTADGFALSGEYDLAVLDVRTSLGDATRSGVELSALSCTLSGGAGPQSQFARCSATFGPGEFTNVDGHDWAHSFQFTAVPEPSVSVLLAIAVLIYGGIRRASL